MLNHRVVVADASRARFFRTDVCLDDFEALPTLKHPEGRLRDSELLTDGPGRARGQGALRGPSAHEHEQEVFAHQIAERLRSELLSRDYERLILIAPPSFLGTLRVRLDEQVARAVVASVPRDFAGIPTDRLVALIRPHLPEDAGLPAEVGQVP